MPKVALRSRTATDSSFVFQRHRAIKVGHAGLVALTAIAIATFLTQTSGKLSTPQLSVVILASVAFIGWNLWGTRHIAHYLEQGYRNDATPMQQLGTNRWQILLHFLGQYLLIAAIYAVAIQVGELRFLWLLLLVPVGHAALFLPAAIAATMAVANCCLLGLAVWFVYGGNQVTSAVLQFGLASTFAFVFAQIAASSERGRAEVAMLLRELTDVNLQLRQYSVQAEELAVSRERNELARNIHDSVGHALTAVNVQLRVAQTMLDVDPGVTKEAITKAQRLASGGLADIRDSVSALRTSPLRDRALDVAIADFLADETGANLQVSLQVEGTPRELPYATQLAFFRSVQEGLTNVRKHTSATNVSVTLDYRDVSVVVLRIVDDGGGASSFNGGFGLVGLRERAVLLGGELTISSRPRAGVQLEMRLPG